MNAGVGREEGGCFPFYSMHVSTKSRAGPQNRALRQKRHRRPAIGAALRHGVLLQDFFAGAVSLYDDDRLLDGARWDQQDRRGLAWCGRRGRLVTGRGLHFGVVRARAAPPGDDSGAGGNADRQERGDDEHD